jgi:hypothetical protein
VGVVGYRDQYQTLAGLLVIAVLAFAIGDSRPRRDPARLAAARRVRSPVCSQAPAAAC